MSINEVAVIGSGTMGRGIAQAAALAGHWVILYDLTEEIVERGLRAIRHSCLLYTSDLPCLLNPRLTSPCAGPNRCHDR